MWDVACYKCTTLSRYVRGLGQTSDQSSSRHVTNNYLKNINNNNAKKK